VRTTRVSGPGTGERVSDPLCAFDDFVDMIGFPKVWDFEKKYADLLADD
jgi:hypothetical protein